VDLQARVVNILTRPKDEWSVIAAERTDVSTLYQSYIAILAAIPPAASFLGLSVVGVSLPLIGHYRYGFVHGIVMVVVQYVLALVGVYVAAMVIDKLAPNFQSESNPIQALKLVAYASTATWVAGVLNLIPTLSPLGILAGLYGIYLFYLGVTPMMKTPPEKVVPYMVVSAIVVIVAAFVVGTITAAITGAMFVGPQTL
jgi:hypothetical protein